MTGWDGKAPGNDPLRAGWPRALPETCKVLGNGGLGNRGLHFPYKLIDCPGKGAE